MSLTDINNSSFVHILYWVLGFSTVRYRDNTVRLGGPTGKAYPIILLIFSIICRVERMHNEQFFTGVSVQAIVFNTLKTTEAIASHWALLSDSILYKRDKLQLHTNLLHIDRLLKVDNSKYKYLVNKVSLGYFIYLTYILINAISDSFRWKSGIPQIFLVMRKMTTDLLMLQFCHEVYLCVVRIRTLNECLRSLAKADTICDFRSTSFLIGTSASEQSISYKHNILSILKAYSTMNDNVKLLSKRIGSNVRVLNAECRGE